MGKSVEAELDRYIREHQNQQIDDICRLVEIDSSRSEALPGMPFGRGAAEALKQALKLAEQSGFSARCVDACVGVVEMEAPLEGVDILSHLDVVPAGNGWTVTPPFSPLVADGRIYGRGAADNKGPSVSVLYALAAVRSLGIPFKRRVKILWGTAEETGSEDIRRYYKRCAPAPMTVSPDASFPVITMEKGRFEGHMESPYTEGSVFLIECQGPANGVPAMARAVVSGIYKQEDYSVYMEADKSVRYEWRIERGATEIRAFGKAAHAAAPQNGINALTALLSVLEHIPGIQTVLKEMAAAFPHGNSSGGALGIEWADAVCDSDTGNASGLTLSLSSLMWSPEKGLNAVFDCRVPAGASREKVVLPIRYRLGQAGIDVSGEFIGAHVVPEDSVFVRTLLDCWKECTGQDSKPRAIAGNTYVHGIPGAVAFGFADPVIRTGTHGPNEYLDITQMMLGTKVYARMILKLCM